MDNVSSGCRGLLRGVRAVRLHLNIKNAMSSDVVPSGTSTVGAYAQVTFKVCIKCFDASPIPRLTKGRL